MCRSVATSIYTLSSVFSLNFENQFFFFLFLQKLEKARNVACLSRDSRQTARHIIIAFLFWGFTKFAGKLVSVHRPLRFIIRQDGEHKSLVMCNTRCINQTISIHGWYVVYATEKHLRVGHNSLSA